MHYIRKNNEFGRKSMENFLFESSKFHDILNVYFNLSYLSDPKLQRSIKPCIFLLIQRIHFANSRDVFTKLITRIPKRSEARHHVQHLHDPVL